MNTYIVLARDSRLPLCLLSALTGQPANHEFTLALRCLSIENSGHEFSELGLNFWRVLRWERSRITLQSTVRSIDGKRFEFVFPEFAPTADLDKVGIGTITEEIIKSLLLSFLGGFYSIGEQGLLDSSNKCYIIRDHLHKLGFDDVSLSYGNPIGSLLPLDWVATVVPVVSDDGLYVMPYYGPLKIADLPPSSNVAKGDISLIARSLLSRLDLQHTILTDGHITSVGRLDPRSTERTIFIPWRKK